MSEHISYLGYIITPERYTVTSSGYDKDSIQTSYHTRYIVGSLTFSTLEEAKIFLFKKSVKGRKMAARIRQLQKKEKALDNKARILNRKIEKLYRTFELAARKAK